jgi:hypothetical protein
VTTTDTATRSPAPPPIHRVSILPAAAVLGVAVATLVLFTALNFIASPRTATTTQPDVVGSLPIGTTHAFAPWLAYDIVPANVASALIVPRGTRYLSAVDVGGAQEDFDSEARFVVHAPRARLLGFYRSHYVGLGWSVISASPAAGGADQLLFQRGGSDGFYWEAGVTATAPSATTTPFTLRLFQVADYS